MKKRIIMILVLCLAVFLAGCMSKASKPIAEVNGEKITQADFDALYAVIKADYESTQNVKVDEQKDQEVVKNIQDKTYDNLILQKLIRQDAARQGIKIDQKEVDETIEYIQATKNKDSQDGFKEFLKETNFTEAGLNEYLQTQQLNTNIKDKMTAGIKVDDAEVRQYYDDNQNQFEDQGGIHIYHILTSDKQKALEVIKKLKGGADFAVLAKEYSLDESNKDQGGDLQYVNENTNFVPEFKKAALALEPGQYTQEPVKSQFGYHIIKAGERKAAGIMSFDQVQDQLKAQLEAEQKDRAFNEYLEKLKKEADIKDLRKK